MIFATPQPTSISGESSVQSNVETIVRNLAHDLRQPLSAIESIAFYLDLMMEDGDAKTRKQVSRLRHLVQQTNWVVSNAIHTAGSAPLALAVADMGTIVSEAVTAWAAESGSQVTLVRPDQIRQQLLDEQQITLALTNVLSFTPRAGSAFVTIASTESSTEVEITSAEMRAPEEDALAMRATQRIIGQHGGSLLISESSVLIRLPLRF